MTLEEDWLWSYDKDHIPAVGMAIQVLEHDSQVVGVFLRSVVQFGQETSIPGTWTETREIPRHAPLKNQMHGQIRD